MTSKREKLTPIPKRAKQAAARPAPRKAADDAASVAGPDLSHIAESLRPLAVRTADLAFLADNPLDHDEREIEEMRAILRARGQLVPLIVNRRPTPPVVLGGNKRLRAMLAESREWAAVVNVDLDDDDAAALAVELNATQGTLWNKERLQAALYRVGKLNLGEHRDAMMTRLAEAQELIPRLGGGGANGAAADPGPQVDRAAELQAKWQTATGQRWKIGSHHLWVGDSRQILPTWDAASIDLFFTDPPYGHNNNNNNDLAHRREAALGRLPSGAAAPVGRPIANDGPEANELVQWFFGEANRLLKPGCCCCCCGGGPDPQFARWSLWMDDAIGFKQMIVWDKGGLGMGWHYRRCYEVVLVGEKPGAACHWYGGHDTPNVIRDIGKIIPSAEQHPTEKPSDLAKWFIEKHSQPGEIIGEPFAGSGSTIAACEQTGRVCRAVECDAGFAASILERLAGLGLEPRLEIPS